MRLPNRTDAGFTLIEALVAFALFVVAFTVLLQSMWQSTRSDIRAEFEMAAVRVAQSQMDRMGFDQPLTPGDLSGTAGGLNWVSHTLPYSTSASDAYWVTIVVRRGSLAFELTALKRRPDLRAGAF